MPVIRLTNVNDFLDFIVQNEVKTKRIFI
jgi:hypothetical protein